MKKILIVLISLVLIWFFFIRETEIKTNPENKNTSASFKPEPVLSDFTDIEGELTLLKERAYGDLNNDDKTDTAVLIAESGGGSGVFIYVASYVSGPVNYKGSNSVFIGDRISPKSLSITNGVVKVEYLDRKEDEPFAAEPTVPKTLELRYKNGELSELTN